MTPARPIGLGQGRLARAVALALGAALVALAARHLGPLTLELAAMAGLVAGAAVAPAPAAALLLLLVILQDWLVGLGAAVLQHADEALLLAGLSGLALAAVARRRSLAAPLDLPIAAFAAAGALSALANGVSPWIAGLGILAVWKGPLAYALLVRNRVAEQRVEQAARVFLALVALLAAIGVAQRVGGARVFALTGRAAYYAEWQGGKAPSLFYNHNALGHVCVLGGLLAAGLALAGPSGRRRVWALGGLVCLAGLVVSASRESWLAAAVALLAGAAVTRSRRLLVVSVGVAVVLAAGAVAVYFGSPFLRAEIARRTAGVVEGWHLYSLGFTDWAYRGEYRIYVILKSWRIFLDHPLLGVGPGRYGGQVAFAYGTPVYEQYAFLPLRGAYYPLDVFWSRLLAEFGLLGTLAYGLATALAAGQLLRALRAASALVRGLALGGLMALAAAVVVGFFAPALEDPLVALPVWALAGVVRTLDGPAGRLA